MELSCSNIKKIPHIFSKESISYISENPTLFRPSPKNKRTPPWEICCTLGKRKL